MGVTREPIDLSDLRNFRSRGFCVVRDAIVESELEVLREAYDEVVTKSSELSSPSREDFKYRPILRDNAPGETSPLSRIEYTFDKSPIFFYLLGNPVVATVAASLLDGPGLVTWEDMVVKAPGCGEIALHQDNIDIEQSAGVVFDVAVYFDDSAHDPLVVYPGTHELGNLSLAECEQVAERRSREAIEVPVRAGDLLIHNVRTIHGSRANHSTRSRRVLYFEFRTVEQVRNSSPWADSWLARRLPYVLSALQSRAAAELAYIRDDDPYTRDQAAAIWSTMHPSLRVAPLRQLDLRVSHEQPG